MNYMKWKYIKKTLIKIVIRKRYKWNESGSHYNYQCWLHFWKLPVSFLSSLSFLDHLTLSWCANFTFALIFKNVSCDLRWEEVDLNCRQLMDVVQSVLSEHLRDGHKTWPLILMGSGKRNTTNTGSLDTPSCFTLGISMPLILLEVTLSSHYPPTDRTVCKRATSVVSCCHVSMLLYLVPRLQK